MSKRSDDIYYWPSEYPVDSTSLRNDPEELERQIDILLDGEVTKEEILASSLSILLENKLVDMHYRALPGKYPLNKHDRTKNISDLLKNLTFLDHETIKRLEFCIDCANRAKHKAGGGEPVTREDVVRMAKYIFLFVHNYTEGTWVNAAYRWSILRQHIMLGSLGQLFLNKETVPSILYGPSRTKTEKILSEINELRDLIFEHIKDEALQIYTLCRVNAEHSINENNLVFFSNKESLVQQLLILRGNDDIRHWYVYTELGARGYKAEEWLEDHLSDS